MLSKPSPNLSPQSFHDHDHDRNHNPTTITITTATAPSPSPSTFNDGFTPSEITTTLSPLTRTWSPSRAYDALPIAALTPGPRAVTFSGRVVSLRSVVGWSATQPRAAGWQGVVVRDGVGAVNVKLYFPHKPYPLRLGQLLSVWTAFISTTSNLSPTHSNPQSITTTTSSGPLICANIFPGRVTSDHLVMHTDSGSSSACRTPFDYRPAEPLPGLMTLANYLHGGGHDGVVGVKLLLCVKSIGPRKKIKITRKVEGGGGGGGEIELVDVLLFDHTDEVRLSLWSELIASAMAWTPWETVLLISDPGFKGSAYAGKGGLAVQRATMVDVEPECADADWLRRFAAGRARRERLCVDVGELEGLWDVDAVLGGVWRIYFTLAEVDEWVRSNPHQIFTGWINVTIMEMSLVLHHRRNMLMCAECCGVPIFSNTLTSTCQTCTAPLTHSLNPQILGPVVDETGCIAGGKLHWTAAAWAELLGRSVADVATMTGEEIGWLQQRVVFTRLHLAFGWAESVGRLVVLAVRC